MSKNRVIVASVVLENRPKSEVARDYGVTYRWVHTLVRRYEQGGWDAVEPQSRKPKTSPRRTSPEVTARILELREKLTDAGYDAGPATIAAHLETETGTSPNPATIWKILKRHGLVEAQPRKRPRSSYRTFEADLPNETWQSDFMHWHLTDGTGTEILTFLDDHSRYGLRVTAHYVVTGTIVVNEFRTTINEHGPPASTLTDNGLVFTTRVRGGKNAFENELRLLNITQKNGRPNHPQTQGKVERFQQTLKKWLRNQPAADTLEKLQEQLDEFTRYYNQTRPHRSLKRATPATAYNAKPKDKPNATIDGHWRIRHDRVDSAGSVTIRYNARLHHIGVGRAHNHTPVVMLIHNRDIRIIDAETGELLRELTIDPTRDYQPQKPQIPLQKGEGNVNDDSRHI